MRGYLLDTNVISELRRPRPDAKVVAFIAAQPLERLFLSVVTLAEIRFGIECVANASKRTDLTSWLEHKVRPMFEDRTLPVSEDVILRWRLLVEEGRKQGHTYSQPDLIIAATALHYDLAVATRDIDEFERSGTPALNPWRVSDNA